MGGATASEEAKQKTKEKQIVKATIEQDAATLNRRPLS